MYVITCTQTDKKYIGRKLFWFTRTRRVGGKRKRELRESDWRTYYSSSNSLKRDVELLGTAAFRREVLYLCATKSQMNYLEVREQVDRRVLETEEYYNEEIRCRVHRNKSLNTPARR